MSHKDADVNVLVEADYLASPWPGFTTSTQTNPLTPESSSRSCDHAPDPRDTNALEPDTNTRTIHRAPVSSTGPAQALATNESELLTITKKLSNIQHGLQIRSAIVELDKSSVDLNTLIYREGSLFIDNYTLGDFLLSASHSFLDLLRRLQANRQRCPWHELLQQLNVHPSELSSSDDGANQNRQSSAYSDASPPSPLDCAGSLSHHLASLIINIFTQLISFYELFLEHMTSRIERLGTEPVAPVPGIIFEGTPLAGPCAQGHFFCTMVIGILRKMEHAVVPKVAKGKQSACGLLSTKQIDMLWSKFDGSDGVASGSGIMRPADVEKLYQQIAGVFERLSRSYME